MSFYNLQNVHGLSSSPFMLGVEGLVRFLDFFFFLRQWNSSSEGRIFLSSS